MGIVQKQGIQNTLIAILGVALGYFNKIFLFVDFLDETGNQYGLIELLIAFMVVGTEVSQLGISKIIIRFFPYFYQKKNKEGAFLMWILLYALGGFLLLSAVFYFFGPWFVSLYKERTVLFPIYYYYLFHLILAHSLNRVLAALSQAQLKSVVPTFALQVGLRLFHTITILLYAKLGFSFEAFLQLYVSGYYFPFLLTLIYLIWLGKLKVSFDLSFFRHRIAKIMLMFGLYTTLTDAAIILVNRLDAIMVGKELGETSVGAYAFAFYVSMLIYIPARAINAIAVPLVSRQLKQKLYRDVEILYQKTAITNLVIGSYLLIGICTNLNLFFELRPTFSEAYSAAIILGFGILFNISTGINRAIIINSKYYRYDLYSNLVMLILVFIGNYFLIPIYGLTGAAFTTASALLIYNSAGSLFIWWRMSIHPFSKKTLQSVVISAITLLIIWFIPRTSSPVLDILIRGTSTTVIFVLLIVKFELIPELNQFILTQFNRFKK